MTTIGCITINLSLDICGPERISPDDFNDPQEQVALPKYLKN